MSENVEDTSMLARIVVDEHLVGRSTMARVLQSRGEERAEESLADYLLLHGYVTPGQYERIRALGRDAGASFEDEDPVLFGEVLVARGLATPEDVGSCLREQAALSANGVYRNLGELLIEKGILRPEQVRDLLREKQKVIMVCPQCSERFNVVPTEQGHAKCPVDSTPLRDSRAESSIGVAGTLSRAGDSPIGMELGGCRIVELIGRGAMGAVYKGRQLRLNRYVAIKMLRADSRDRERVRRLLGEARAVAKLEHPNLVQVFDVGYEMGYFYIVMQLLKGQTLEDRLLELGSLPVQESMEIARAIAQGLSAAHERGVIHRDLKPANVMLSGEDIPKLTDFGLAQDPEDPEERPGFVVGTPLYMSTEQIKGLRADARSDLYSLGVTLYQMVTGRRPFEGSSVDQIFKRHMKEKPRPPHLLNPDLPEGLSSVILKLLAKDPTGRYSDAVAFIGDLDRVARGNAPEAAAELGESVRCGFCEASNPAGSAKCSICHEPLGEQTGPLRVVGEEDETFSCPACNGANPAGAEHCRQCNRRFCHRCRRRLVTTHGLCSVCRTRRVRRAPRPRR